MVVEVTGDPIAAFQVARKEARWKRQEGAGVGKVAPPHAGGPAHAPAASQPHPPAPRPGLTAASHVSRGVPAERLDLIRKMVARQREMEAR